MSETNPVAERFARQSAPESQVEKMEAEKKRLTLQARELLEGSRDLIPEDLYAFMMDRFKDEPVRVAQSSVSTSRIEKAAPVAPTVAKPEAETKPDRYAAEKTALIRDLISSGFLAEKDREYLMKKMAGENVDRSSVIEFTFSVVQALDPSGTSQFENETLWKRTVDLLKTLTDLTMVYPKPKTKLNLKDHEIDSVDRRVAGFNEHEIVNVTSFGYSKDGQTQRRARVVVAS